MIGPSLVLSVLVGLLWTSVYVFLRGSAGGQLLLVYLAAALGAWAGDSIAARLRLDALLIGDYHVLGASVVAWAGMAIVVIVGVLAPARRKA